VIDSSFSGKRKAKRTMASIRPTKKLKSAEDDLEVVVGVGSLQKSYYCNSAVLALHSNVIDTMLSVEMREKESRRIAFPDLAPDQWEKMMEFMEDGAGANITPEETAMLLEYYDKYEFAHGLDLVDKAIAKVIAKKGPSILSQNYAKPNYAQELDAVVTELRRVEKYNLPAAKKQLQIFSSRSFKTNVVASASTRTLTGRILTR